MKKNKIYILIGCFILLVGIFVIGQFFIGGSHTKHTVEINTNEKKIKYWTCSMHPQIKLPDNSSLCPLCAMDLIPVYEDSELNETGSEVSMTLNTEARALAEIQTTEVVYKTPVHKIRLVGKVDYDETRLSYISAWAPGRIDRLFVDYTGIKVRKGDHLIELYSPELISAQQEYLQAVKNWEDTKRSELEVMRQTAQNTKKSSREKLRLLGLNENQIQTLEQTGQSQEHVTINSPVTGTVIHKNGFEGMYVKTGDKIYTIADLTQVWLYLDAYETDLQWLHYGQKVKVQAEAYPGETFQGKIAFVDPFVNEKTRTIKLRVNVENKDQKLKPGMFVRAVIESNLAKQGQIYDETLARKWICPMHPEIVKDHQEPCDICGMDLVETREFGFSDLPQQESEVLVIPKSAPMLTGKRAVVYVENPTQKEGIYRYEGREVVLGPRADDDYIVVSGLNQGERVVTKGNFKIDSALQIHAKPSMMNPGQYYTTSNVVISQYAHSNQDAGVLKDSLKYYLKASKALAHDELNESLDALKSFEKEITSLFEKNLVADGSEGLGAYLHMILHQLDNLPQEIKPLREMFGNISTTLKVIFEEYEYKENSPVYLSFCPMAFKGQGGYWFQSGQDVQNPYYGSRMFACGEIQKEYGRKTIPKQTKGSHKGSHGHNH